MCEHYVIVFGCSPICAVFCLACKISAPDQIDREFYVDTQTKYSEFEIVDEYESLC